MHVALSDIGSNPGYFRRTLCEWMQCVHKETVLIHLQQFHLKNEGGVGWNNASGTSRTIAQMRWNCQAAFASFLHTGYALVPTFDDLAHAKLKL